MQRRMSFSGVQICDLASSLESKLKENDLLMIWFMNA